MRPRTLALVQLAVGAVAVGLVAAASAAPRPVPPPPPLPPPPRPAWVPDATGRELVPRLLDPAYPLPGEAPRRAWWLRLLVRIGEWREAVELRQLARLLDVKAGRC